MAIAPGNALNIPARFVVGHVLLDAPPPDFLALFDAWSGGRWVLFCPTQTARTDEGICIGTGHDAVDLPFATIFGGANMTRMSPLVFPALSDVRMAT